MQKMDPKYYKNMKKDELIQELLDRDEHDNKVASKEKSVKRFKLPISIGVSLVVVGLIVWGVGYYLNTKDVITIRSSKSAPDINLALAKDAENTLEIKQLPEIDPLSSLMIFQADLADSSSIKIICQQHSIPGADVYGPLAEWAKRQGFHAIMFGNILSFNDRILLTGPENLDIEAICKRLHKQGITRAISVAINSQMLELPYPFEFTSLGHVSFVKEKVKTAFVIPTKKHTNKMISANMSDEITHEGQARVYVGGKPFEGIPTNTPVKKFQ